LKKLARVPFICSAPSFRKTAPNEPISDEVKIRKMELRGVVILSFSAPV
jgi:hypothetical protein